MRIGREALVAPTAAYSAMALQSLAQNVFLDARAGVPPDIPGNNAKVSVDRTFTTAGTYTYTCHIHPAMHGTIVVH